jgi:tricorn protease
MPSPCYLRFPAVAGDLLAFAADDDVWLSTLDGGTARRLTSEHAPVSSVALSPDGSAVAYASRRDGEPEIYVVDTAGGDVRRITYWGDAMTRVVGWDGDEVVVVSAGAEPFRSRTWAYRVPATGGAPERLPYGPCTAVKHGPEGAVVLGVNQNARRGASWKRYRGGTAAALWIDRSGQGVFERFLTELDGQREDPCFVGGRVAFVSDHEGWGNVYSVEPAGSDLRRHTDHDGFYARAASSDGRRIVYQCAGDLYVLDDLEPSSQPRRLEIELGAPRSGRAPHVLEAADHLGEHSPGADGRGSAVELRGTIFWLTHKEGPARVLGCGGGARARLPRAFGPAGKEQVAWVTDAEGDDALELSPATGAGTGLPQRLHAGAVGRVLDLAGSPDGRQLALATHDGRVCVVELEGGELRTLEQCPHGEATGLTFSADSRWLAWSRAGEFPLRNIRLARVEDGECVDATPLRFVDENPVFSLDGKYLAFLSMRTFDPIYDAHVFDMSFQAATRPYLVTLDAAAPSPFDAEADGRPRLEDDDHPHRGEHAEQASLSVDLDGIAGRVVPVPVIAAHYSNLRAVEDGLAFLEEPTAGVLGEGGRRAADKERPRITGYDIERGRRVQLVDIADSFEVSGDGRSLVVRDEKHLRVLPSDRCVDRGDAHRRPDDLPPVDAVDDVDLSRVRLRIDPAVEWRQMFDETARLMRDNYWIEDMAGVEWDAVVARYRPLVERVATRHDLSELIWEVQGELATSHCYEDPPPRPVEEARRLGFLGADLERDAGGTWRVARILPPESSLPSARSPLAEPGVAMSSGDAILAVDGRPVDPELGPAASLVGAAGRPVELLVQSAGNAEPRRVAVVPLADERQLRYQHWVAGRREAVHRATGGRVGYLHVPDMMGYGWAELHRDLRIEVARDGLVVDVRDNRGGHTSQLVLEKLARRVLGWDVVRHKSSESYPLDSPRGPIVALTNEQAGSDGDIITASFKLRRLGPVVGTRTWGGVIGIDGQYDLVDRTSVTQPRYSFWFEELGWGVENYGVDPDVEVHFPPQDWASGRDPQLDEAVRLVVEAFETRPPARPPDPSTRPSRAAPSLPARPGAGAGAG